MYQKARLALVGLLIAVAACAPREARESVTPWHSPASATSGRASGAERARHERDELEEADERAREIKARKRAAKAEGDACADSRKTRELSAKAAVREWQAELHDAIELWSFAEKWCSVRYARGAFVRWGRGWSSVEETQGRPIALECKRTPPEGLTLEWAEAMAARLESSTVGVAECYDEDQAAGRIPPLNVMAGNGDGQKAILAIP